MFEKFKRKKTQDQEPVIPEAQAVKRVPASVTPKVRVPVSESKTAAAIILVDASNVAHGNSAGKHEPRLENVLVTLSSLVNRGAKVITIADATLRHKIDQKDALEKMLDESDIMQVPAASSADDYIWEIAQFHQKRGSRVFIVTNDRFPITKATTPETKSIKRITFMLIEKDVFFQPSLEDALKDTQIAPPAKPPAESTQKAPEVNKQERPRTETAKPPNAGERKTHREERKKPELTPDLLKVIVDYLGSRRVPVKPGDRVDFASISNFLHKKYGGNFCAVLGFRRPKDLATLLEANGYVLTSHSGTTLYIEPTPKLMEKPAKEGSVIN
ncbi:MAG: hypothetical protein M1151_06450 [Candidatus Thermoplasmatota archaeon]|jgi:hypothetical protein|nr:hypothetical protein [Candidatus Thermoplasmatota archaeon]MCL5786289.1 hypothetical protein [Candidatus Thermoplasmatota archaeon]